MRQVKFWWLLKTAVLSGLLITAGSQFARAVDTAKPGDDNRPTTKQSSQKQAGRKLPGQGQPGQAIEMFAGIKAGQIEVKFIPKDSTQGRIFIKNKTDKPLRVELPKAAGAVPVLAQMGGMGGGMGGMGGRGGMQSMGMGGGGMGGGGMGGGMGGMGGGGGMFNVAPEKVAEVKVACVCLEHGKAEPRPTANYELRPIEKVTTKPGVRELCSMLGQIPQRVAQAAAWNLNSDMSWQQLAAKRIERADGSSYPYFDMGEIAMAMAAANQAVDSAKTAPETTAPTTDAGKPVSPGQTVQAP